jgi:hypothetical protein
MMFKTFEVANVIGDPFFFRSGGWNPIYMFNPAQCLCRFQEELKDIKEVIRIPNSKKETQHKKEKQ